MATPAKDELGENADVAMTEPSGVSSPKELRNAIYARCAMEDEDHVFNQEQLLSFKLLPENTVEALIVHTNRLTKEGLLKLMTKDSRVCWKVVKKSDAAKYVILQSTEAIRL